MNSSFNLRAGFDIFQEYFENLTFFIDFGSNQKNKILKNI